MSTSVSTCPPVYQWYKANIHCMTHASLHWTEGQGHQTCAHKYLPPPYPGKQILDASPDMENTSFLVGKSYNMEVCYTASFHPNFSANTANATAQCTVPHSEPARVGFFFRAQLGNILHWGRTKTSALKNRMYCQPRVLIKHGTVREKKKGLTIFCLVTFLATYRKSAMAQLLQ